MMSTGAQGQFNGARSQLATNRFLLVLGQVFGTATFTSRDASNRLGLDFLNTCKRLSRMSKKPYHLLSTVRFARPWGGYENSYTISGRGWRKINYLQRHPARAQKPIAGNSPEKQWRAYYLMKGKGDVHDPIDNACFRCFVAPILPPVTTPLDEIGLMLLNFDPGVMPLEVVNLNLPENEVGKTAFRAQYLQSKGLIPQDINVPSFVLNATQMGGSSQTILLALLLRGGINLRDEAALKDKQATQVIEVAQAIQTVQQKSSSPPRTGCENCSRYEKRLDLEEIYSKSLELENSSLQKKLDQASLDSTLESIRLNNRIIKYRNYIEMSTRCLGLVSEGLDKVIGKDPPITLLPVKSYINTALAGIGLMNSMA